MQSGRRVGHIRTKIRYAGCPLPDNGPVTVTSTAHVAKRRLGGGLRPDHLRRGLLASDVGRQANPARSAARTRPIARLTFDSRGPGPCTRWLALGTRSAVSPHVGQAVDFSIEPERSRTSRSCSFGHRNTNIGTAEASYAAIAWSEMLKLKGGRCNEQRRKRLPSVEGEVNPNTKRLAAARHLAADDNQFPPVWQERGSALPPS